MNLFNILAIEISVERFLQSLPYVGYGMLGIFIVIGIIILVMTGMTTIENKIKSKKIENQEDKTE